MSNTKRTFILLAVWLCAARSILGHYYSATGPTEAEAQANALSTCQQSSFACYPTTCNQVSN